MQLIISTNNGMNSNQDYSLNSWLIYMSMESYKTKLLFVFVPLTNTPDFK